MKRCGKCDSPVADDVKICRVCGAIVDGPLASFAAEGEEAALPPRILERPWRCPTCGEQIDASFEICWSCGTSSDGTLDPSFVREEDAEHDFGEARFEAYDEPPPAFASPPATPARLAPFCARCGSRRIVENARLAPEGPPIRLVAADGATLGGEVVADVCSDCGRVEWRLVS